jgi:hypothetical protein
MKEETMVGLLSVLAVFAAGTPVYAGPVYGFYDITNPGSLNALIGESQLFMEVRNVVGDPGKVRFNFFNLGPEACSVCDVYFDDGSLLGISEIINEPGVSFSSPATPSDLPGGNSVTPPFETTGQFSADSNPPHLEQNGVDQPTERLGIVFSLKNGGTYADVLNELALQDLRVGLHVQGFDDGGSQSFINCPGCPTIPAPAALLLSLLGVGLVGHLRSRRLLEN